ncbi:MAG: c-type cytochrome [Bacteroidetes bacterium]|nr:c-type cytochrome [Bacteroidota bacterium]
MHLRYGRRALVLVAACVLASACSTSGPPATPLIDVPAGFPQPHFPEDNALTADRIALGKKLFYDKQLSRTSEVACGSCHLQEHAFADPRPLSIGVNGQLGKRNAPSLANMVYNTSYFWDGGVPTLEQQAIQPIINPLEMNMTLGEVVSRVSADPAYVDMFRRAYNSEPKPEFVTKAIASFVRTLVSGRSRYDRYQQGDTTALTASELRGMNIFFGEKAECFHCHIGFNFTNNGYRNNGIYATYADKGRELITEDPADEGKFKVPTLRNIALTAPYMHDGSFETLDAVVNHYTSGGQQNPNADAVIRPFVLTPQERTDLIAFLTSLTDEQFVADAKFKP